MCHGFLGVFKLCMYFFGKCFLFFLMPYNDSLCPFWGNESCFPSEVSKLTLARNKLNFHNLRFRPHKLLKMIVWTSVLWQTKTQLEKIWPEMVKLLKYIIVIWIESEYSCHFVSCSACKNSSVWDESHVKWANRQKPTQM